jgi:hypothetical protein
MGMNMFVFVFVVMVVMMLMLVVMIVVMIVVVVMVVVMIVFVVMIVVVIVVVVMVVVVMMLMTFLLPFNENAEMGADDATFHRRLSDKTDARQPKRVHFLDKSIFIVQKLIQCGGEHIAGGPHSTIQIKRSHFLSH